MSISTLRAIPQPPVPKPIAEQIAQLQADARELAAQNAELLARDLAALIARATDIADCSLSEVGVREVARRLIESLRRDRLTLEALNARSR